MRETDLFPALKKYLEQNGFTVNAEVNTVDIVAVKDETMIIVEMKTSFSLKLIYQGCKRQKMCDNVYLAVPPITNRKTLKERLHILRRLHLGLLFVDIEKGTVEPVLDPSNYAPRKSKRDKSKLLKEIKNRQTSINIGGTTKKKLVTAYREDVIKVGYHLLDGPKSIKELKALTSIYKVSSIIHKNYYNWFNRVDRGVYELTSLGKTELLQYVELFDKLVERTSDVINHDT